MNNLQVIICILLSLTYAFIIGFLFYMRLKDSEVYNPKDFSCYGDTPESDHIIARKLGESEFECINNINAGNKYVCGVFKDANTCQTTLNSMKGGDIGYGLMAKYRPLYESNKYKDTIDTVLEYIKNNKSVKTIPVVPKTETKPEAKPEAKPESETK